MPAASNSGDKVNSDGIYKAATLLNAMANPHRLIVLELLHDEGEMSVSTLAARLATTQSGLSQHLAKLKAAGVVKTRRKAQTIYYSSDSAEVKRVLDALKKLIIEDDAVDTAVVKTILREV